MAFPLLYDRRIVVLIKYLIVASWTVQHLGGAIVAQVLLQVLIVSRHSLFTLERALINYEAFADPAMTASIPVGDHLRA